jgi:CubicO group peptidase (beta-lactamase class C family)
MRWQRWLVGVALVGLGCGGPQTEPGTDITAERGRPRDSAVLVPWMDHYRIPGLSMAVVRGDSIDWVQGYGTADEGSGSAVTESTIFQAASISKPVAALTSLLVFRELGLSLDADIGQYLTSWRIPDNPFTAQSPATLRRLLSHSAGFSVHGFLGYQAGASLPTLVQIVDGAAPANSEAVRVTTAPGTFLYSGGGYQVAQQVVEDVSGGEAFAALVQRHVLDPLGMTSSSYGAPVDPGRTAAGHNERGWVIRGRWRRHPEAAAAGLWTTPTDLARLVIGLRRAYHGAGDAVLPAEVARAMLTVVVPTGRPDEGLGLGVFLEGAGTEATFEHGGTNLGYQCNLIAALNGEVGVAIMTNSDNGHRLLGVVTTAILAAYRVP